MKGHKKGGRVRNFVGHTEIPLWRMGGSQREKKGREREREIERREEIRKRGKIRKKGGERERERGEKK